MAAIDIHIGTQAEEDRRDPTCAVFRKGSGQLGAARSCIPPLESTHGGLLRTAWTRRALEDVLKARRYRLDVGYNIGKQSAGDRNKLYFVLDRPLTQLDVPWMPAAFKSYDSFALFGEAAKMACPTWDLPAGAPVTGGTCPGATAGQSTVPPAIREKAARSLPVVRVQEAICQLCYATGGNYASPHVQAGEIVRYWWCQETSAKHPTTFIDTVVRALQGESWQAEQHPFTGKPLYPVRIHSSGDFFSASYAAAWIEVCNQLPQITFWAPTRTWAAEGWTRIWADLTPRLRHGNLSLRPSAYHTGDPAAPLAAPFTSAGTTAIYKYDLPPHDPRFDWSCRTYAVVDDAHSCRNAERPDPQGRPTGQIGCRTCWVQPHLRINYTAH